MTISNLTETASNFVERATTLKGDDWSVVDEFVSQGTETNWADTGTSGLDRAYHRVGSE